MNNTWDQLIDKNTAVFERGNSVLPLFILKRKEMNDFDICHEFFNSIENPVNVQKINNK